MGPLLMGKKLTPLTTHTLKEGDLVQFGVPVSRNTPAEFVYKFHTSLKVCTKMPGGKRLKLDPNGCEDKETLSASDSFEVEDCELKRKKACSKEQLERERQDLKLKMQAELETSFKEHETALMVQLTDQREMLLSEERQEQLERERQDLKLKMQAELETSFKEREIALMVQLTDQREMLLSEERQEQLERERQDLKLKMQAELETSFKEHETALMVQLTDQREMLLSEERQEQLERERQDLKLKMQAELETSFKEREIALMVQLTDQREMLLSEERQEQLERERQDLKLKMQAELETSFKEHETALMVQLTDQREMLLSEERQVLEMKDMEQKLLESQSNETKQENVTAKLQDLKAREDILPNFSELMEMELQCAVCNELLIKATSLNCSHVFCKLCIGQWMKVKMECPNCRCPITSQLPVIALDSYIDQMVELFNSDERQQRSELLQLRKVEQEKFDAAETDSSAVATTYIAEAEESRDTGNSRHRGRSRGTDTSSWEDEYDEGIPDAYYSGNGQSYNCDTSSWEDEYDEGIPDAYYSGNGQSYNCVNHPDSSSWEDEYDEGIPDAYYSGNGQSYNCVNHPDSSSWEDEYDEGIPDAYYSGNGQSYNCAAATSPQADIISRFIQISGENSISIVNHPDSLSWENEYDEGIPDAYYSGYGQCYICGLRSHLSNECPYLSTDNDGTE